MNDTLSDRLREARTMRGYTQQRLSDLCGMPATSIAKHETSERQPNIRSLVALADALDVSTDYLLGRTDTPGLAEDRDPIRIAADSLSARDRRLALELIRCVGDVNRPALVNVARYPGIETVR